MNKVAIVTGGSGGIGRCTARELQKAGCTVYELSRREKPAEGIVHLTADVTDETQVRAAVEEIIRREGRIDILVNNAGFGISGAAESTLSKDSHAQLELNLFGTDNVTRAVLPYMRKQRSGVQVRDHLLRAGAAERDPALRRYGLRDHARRHRLGLYRRARQIRRARRRIRRAHRPQRRGDGARRDDGNSG